MTYSSLEMAKKIMDIHIEYHDDISDIDDDDIKKYVESTYWVRNKLGDPIDEKYRQEIFDYAKRYVNFLHSRPPGTLGVGFLNPESP
jgi:hypothetical protein